MARSKNFPRKFEGFEFRTHKTHSPTGTKFQVFKDGKLVANKKIFTSVPSAKAWVRLNKVGS